MDLLAPLQHSGLYEGWVRHRRLAPCHHEFRYRLYMLLLDLDEVDTFNEILPRWSQWPLPLLTFQPRDYYQGKQQAVDLKSDLSNGFEQHFGVRPQRIALLAHARHLGKVTNPLSCYFGFNQQGEVIGMLAEVTNTPWAERHHYWLAMQGAIATGASIVPISSRDDDRYHYQFSKGFHVSPFNPMAMQYHWNINTPEATEGSKLISHMTLEYQDQPCFDATLHLQQQPVTRSNLQRLLLRYPLMSWQVTAGIYWQALRLYLQGARFYPHPRRLTTRVSGATSRNQEQSHENRQR